MKRDLEPYQLIERSIIKKYRKELWTPFIVAVKRYELVQEGDRIAVCISGGKDSMLMAKLMQELQRHSDVPFELVFLVMDPGYNEINRQKIESNAELLHHFREQHLCRGQQHRQEPLLPLRPDAPGPPVQQGQGVGLQQNCAGPPLQRRD